MAKTKSPQSLFRLEARQEALKILHRLAAEGKIKIEALTLLEMALENKHSLANLTLLSPPTPTASPTNPTLTSTPTKEPPTSVFDDIYINGSVSSNISNTSCGISISEGDVLQVASHRECTKCGLKKPRQHFRKRQLVPKNRFTIRCVSCSKQMHYNKQQLQQRRQQQQHYTQQQQQQQQNTTTPGRPPPSYSYSHAQLGPPHHHFHHYHRPTTTTTTTNYAQQYVPNSVSSSVSSSMNSNSYNTTNSNSNSNSNNNTINTNTNHNPYLQQELPPPPRRCLTMIDHENEDDDASTMFEDDSSMWQELKNMTMTRLRIADDKTAEAATTTTTTTTPTTVTVPSGTATGTITTHSEEGGDGNGNEDTLLLVGSTLDFDWFELLGQHDEEVSSFEFKLEGTSTSPRNTIQNSDDLFDASSLWRNNNPWLQKQQQQQTI